MIPYSATLGYATLLDRLSDAAVDDVDRLMAGLATEPPQVQQEALMDLLPTIGEQYVGASSLVTAQFFTELQAMNEVRRPIEPETLDGVGAKRWHSLVGWGSRAAAFEQGGAALVFSLLSGGLTKILSEASADTMIGNASMQGLMRSQRVPRPGCCAFCGMLASRFAGYSSAQSAGKVVGRGVPLGGGKGRGVKGRGMGIKNRGSREIGEDFHDHCRCCIVVVTAGNEVELQATADKYYESYADAYKKTNDGLELNVLESMDAAGNRHNEYEWVSAGGDVLSPKQRLNSIVTAMRHDLGVK